VPEARFVVRWPDGAQEEYWSPSLVVHDHLAAGRYRVDDVVARTGAAMDEASDRVRARYGTACTSAAATAAAVRSRAAGHDGDALVEVLSVLPPLPGTPS
jgi:uncharacterized repeat protein (TIGR04042 family)